MKEWLTNYMVDLLTEHENKLAEILGALTFFQCLTFLLVSFLAIGLQDTQNKLKKMRRERE
jgi:hypothetical protein